MSLKRLMCFLLDFGWCQEGATIVPGKYHLRTRYRYDTRLRRAKERIKNNMLIKEGGQIG